MSDPGDPPPPPRPSAPAPGPTSNFGPLVRATVILALAVLAFAGLTRACSFAPTASEVDRSRVPRVDVAARVDDARPSAGFALRAPVLPAEWIPQSFDVTPVPGTPVRAVRIGWLTPDDAFVRLVQSPAPPELLVGAEGGTPAVEGAVPAAGLAWTRYPGVRSEEIWVADVGGVRWAITGNATPERFAEVATAAVAATPR